MWHDWRDEALLFRLRTTTQNLVDAIGGIWALPMDIYLSTQFKAYESWLKLWERRG